MAALSTGLKRSSLGRDLAKYLPAQAVPALVGFAAAPIFTRLFTPDEYGNYALVVSTLGLLATVAGWLTLSIVRFFPEYEKKEHPETIQATAMVFSVGSTAVLTLAYVAILIAIRPALSGVLFALMMIGALVFIEKSLFQMLLEFLRARRRINAYSVFTVWQSVATLGFGVWLALALRRDVAMLLYGSVIGCGLALPFLWRQAAGSTAWRLADVRLSLAKAMAGYGLPLVAGNLGGWVLSMADRYFLRVFRSSEEVGLFSVSSALSSQSMMLLIALFGLASAPLIYRAWEQEGEAACKKLIVHVARSYLLIALPAVAGLWLLARPLATLLFGESFVKGYAVMGPVAAGSFLLGLQQMYYTNFHISKKTHFTMIALLGAGVFKGLLTLLFVPRYGFIAAGFTTLMSYGFLLILVVFLANRLFRWPFPFVTLRRVLLASMLMSVVVYPVTVVLSSRPLLVVALGVPLGMAVYGVALLAMGELRLAPIKAWCDKANRRIMRRDR